jgi:tetraacyldisaccharide 4'-kinase
MKYDLTKHWYQSQFHPLSLTLRPLSWLFKMGVMTRRWLYTNRLLSIQQFNVPIIIVGNLTVGGTGKTPFVIWLAKLLQKEGFHPGIVTRGVGGSRKHRRPHWVALDDKPAFVGDEAKLLVKHSNCPVVVGIDRALCVSELLKKSGCNLVICDDGLQHYRLARDIEIVMVDGMRQFGNGCLLPAGPLREGKSRLSEVDFVIVNGQKNNVETNYFTDKFFNHYQMSLAPICLQSISNNQSITLSSFRNRTIHAVCGIGNPDRFFAMLRQAQFNIVPHIFPDHYLYQATDLQFNDDMPVVMTEKDAAKCVQFAKDNWWYVPVASIVEKKLEENLLLKIRECYS